MSEGPLPLNTQSMVSTALKTMKTGKAPSPSSIFVKLLRESITTPENAVIHKKHIPYDQIHPYVTNWYKGKSDNAERGNYGQLLTLLLVT